MHPYFGVSKYFRHPEKVLILTAQNTIIRKINISKYIQLATIILKLLQFILPFWQELCSAVLADKDLTSPVIKHRPFLILFSSVLCGEE